MSYLAYRASGQLGSKLEHVIITFQKNEIPLFDRAVEVAGWQSIFTVIFCTLKQPYYEKDYSSGGNQAAPVRQPHPGRLSAQASHRPGAEKAEPESHRKLLQQSPCGRPGSAGPSHGKAASGNGGYGERRHEIHGYPKKRTIGRENREPSWQPAAPFCSWPGSWASWPWPWQRTRRFRFRL